LDGLRWNSVEHYYQGSKFKKNNPQFYKSFSIDSGSEISQDPALAKSAGGKSGVTKGRRLRPEAVLIDPDFFTGREHTEMFNAMYAKFSQNENLKNILLATNNATLIHGTGRGAVSQPIPELMKVRELLRGGVVNDPSKGNVAAVPGLY